MIAAIGASMLGGSLLLLGRVLWHRHYRWSVLAVMWWAVTSFMLALSRWQLDVHGPNDYTMWARNVIPTGWMIGAAAIVFGGIKMMQSPPGAEPVEHLERRVREYIERNGG